MALILNIPTLSEKPIIVADTRAQKISQALANLQTQNSLDIASHLQTELEILNRQKVSASGRIEALEAYRTLLLNTAYSLADDYVNASLPLHDKAKLAAAAAEALWLELGYGYKLALVDLQNQLIKLGTEKNSVHAIQRAMHAISEYALVNYQTYVLPPEHVWSDLHQLYFCAVQMNVHHFKSELSNSGTPQEYSIENTYKHALLMSLADPQHLTQRDIRLVADYLAYHVNNAQISSVMPLESTSAAFVISLKSDKPPVPYSKQKEAPNATTDIMLNTIDLVRTIHQQLSNLQQNQLPKDGSIPSNASRSEYIDLLTYLIKHWGIIPKRVYNRSQKNGEIELLAGISAIHFVSNNKPIERVQSDDIGTRKSQQVMPSRWQILNISATGVSIRRHPTADKNIKIGSLIGLKTKGEQLWSLGLVRWASCGTKDRLDVGVQLISPQAQSAMARIDGRGADEMVLLLPEIIAAKQVASIITPRGMFEPARQMVLTLENKSIHIMLTRLTDRSQYFERMQYSVIS